MLRSVVVDSRVNNKAWNVVDLYIRKSENDRRNAEDKLYSLNKYLG
jgi:hypothetical protein